MKSALPDRVRGSTTFVDLLSQLAESLERKMADLAATVDERISGVQALAAASVASSAMLLDDGKSPAAEVAKAIEDHIGRAVAFAPEVVGNLAKQAQQQKAAAPVTR